MSNSKQSNVEREQFWRLVFEEHASSQMSVRAFCRRESLSEPSFYSWRRKIHRRDSIAPPTNQTSKPTSGAPKSSHGLIPVHVIEEQHQAAGHTIEIVAPGNVVVRVQEGCSTEALARVLTAVRETLPC